jgi:hypothetical protein
VLDHRETAEAGMAHQAERFEGDTAAAFMRPAPYYHARDIGRAREGRPPLIDID